MLDEPALVQLPLGLFAGSSSWTRARRADVGWWQQLARSRRTLSCRHLGTQQPNCQTQMKTKKKRDKKRYKGNKKGSSASYLNPSACPENITPPVPAPVWATTWAGRPAPLPRRPTTPCPGVPNHHAEHGFIFASAPVSGLQKGETPLRPAGPLSNARVRRRCISRAPANGPPLPNGPRTEGVGMTLTTRCDIRWPRFGRARIVVPVVHSLQRSDGVPNSGDDTNPGCREPLRQNLWLQFAAAVLGLAANEYFKGTMKCGSARRNWQSQRAP